MARESITRFFMITFLTSSFVDGAKDESRGDNMIEALSVGGIAGGGRFVHRNYILSSKFLERRQQE